MLVTPGMPYARCQLRMVGRCQEPYPATYKPIDLAHESIARQSKGRLKLSKSPLGRLMGQMNGTNVLVSDVDLYRKWIKSSIDPHG